jgi:uncharacterized damage-inducible protein DinB
MATRREAIDELEAAYQRFRAKIADLPDDAYAETWLGSWNLSQVLAHMAGWFHEMTGAFERVARGERPTPEGVDYSNADPWNAKFAATASPGRAALDVWDLRYKKYREAAEALDESFYGENEGRPKIGNRLLTGAGIHHFAEHEPQLDAWLASRRS